MSDYRPELTRRAFAGAVAAFGALSVLGCSDGRSQAPGGGPPAESADSALRPMIVYRDPSCPCCEKWAALAPDAGFQVRMVDRPDMPAIKAQHGVPDDLASCHTGVIGGFAIEGHVPFEQVTRLLAERPEGIIGLAVAGMPLGSPGMETGSGAAQPYQVIAFGRSGERRVYAEYGGRG